MDADVVLKPTRRGGLSARDGFEGSTIGEEQLCAVIPISRAWGYEHIESLTSVLGEYLAQWEAEAAAGPHIVVARGHDLRCFGPFPNHTAAYAAARSHAEEWAAECPDLMVTFEAVPLLSCREIMVETDHAEPAKSSPIAGPEDRISSRREPAPSSAYEGAI